MNKTAGVSFSLAVNALGSDSLPTADYRGTVRFTSTDPDAVLPGDYTYTAADSGSHNFSGVMLRTGGAQTITVTDTSAPAVTGSRTFNVAVPGARALEVGTMVASTSVGAEIAVLVKAVSNPGVADSNYRGTVTFSSSTDPTAVLPVNYTFTDDDQGERLFCPAGTGEDCSGGVTFSSVNASHTVTVTDTATPTITGTSNAVNVVSNEVVRFSIVGSSLALTGGEALVVVTAVNAQGALVSTYAGTVGLTSTDPAASIPPDHTFTLVDRGEHDFFVRMGTVGVFTVTAVDRANPSITGVSQQITVSQGPPVTTTTTSPDLRSTAPAPPPPSGPLLTAPTVTGGRSGSSGVVSPAPFIPAVASVGSPTSGGHVANGPVGPAVATTTTTSRTGSGATAGGGGALARTGSPALNAVGVAGVALAGGAWFVVASAARRRPTAR